MFLRIYRIGIHYICKPLVISENIAFSNYFRNLNGSLTRWEKKTCFPNEYLETTKEIHAQVCKNATSVFLLLLYSLFQYAATMTTVKMGKDYSYFLAFYKLRIHRSFYIFMFKNTQVPHLCLSDIGRLWILVIADIWCQPTPTSARNRKRTLDCVGPISFKISSRMILPIYLSCKIYDWNF